MSNENVIDQTIRANEEILSRAKQDNAVARQRSELKKAPEETKIVVAKENFLQTNISEREAIIKDLADMIEVLKDVRKKFIKNFFTYFLHTFQI